MVASTPLRLFYVDDSGAEITGFATFSWIELRIDDWKPGLRQVLNWRKGLMSAHRIPPLYELHATKFANGRGNPSLDEEWNRKKSNRSVVMDECVNFLAERSWVGMGTVYSKTTFRGVPFAKERARVYQELVKLIDGRLLSAGEFGLLVMDGDGTDDSYISAHRSLPLQTRCLIEDPIFQNSHRSQWVQLADITAYSAYQHLLQHESKRFAWPWYPRLSVQDVLGEPQEV